MKKLIAIALLLAPLAAAGQSVTFHPQPEQPLAERWAWAERQATGGDFWIGYAIERRMPENHYIGSWSSNRQRPTLHEVLYNEKPPRSVRDQDRGSKRMVTKDLAFLFAVTPGGAVREVDVTVVEGEVNLEGHPLYWLGGAADGESLGFVQQRFARADDEVKEDLIVAFAMHEADGPVFDALSGILTGPEDDEIREDAAFWLGQRDDARALDLLVRTAREDRAEEVRKQAVFALSQMELPEATEALITLARSGEWRIRKEAIFWLGQEASERAVAALGELVEESDEVDVQKQAVFALSQLDESEGVPLLIEIARTHENARIRKEAIFWLGESDDPRALDALIALVRDS